jgi:hypothetical protein
LQELPAWRERMRPAPRPGFPRSRGQLNMIFEKKMMEAILLHTG